MHAGIPQLVLPGRLDQFDNAQHVEKLGCGLVGKGLLDNANAAEKLRQLLRSPEITNTSRTLRDRMMPSRTACSHAADAIEEVWLSSRPGRYAPPPSMQRIAS
jgi:UDP:flavonoid glycosyltransferase YjiC (YdhE family)